MKLQKSLFVLLLCIFNRNIATDPENIDSGTEEASATPSSDESTTPNEFEIVSLENFGQIKGFLEKSSNGNHFYSFLGIPYAKPPTGTNRLKNPEVSEGWEGVRDGTVAPPPCSQMDLDTFIKQPKASYVGQEDCLYLNIYTPEPNPEFAQLPVLVYFHGGNFVSGSASDYEPYDLLDTPVVLVVLQYRLGVLGFLSTEDEVIPGNFGLKDQTLALKWINRYIGQFGGSPLKVTLFGSDAGAASVHFQTLTYKTIGLFKRAILQSGNALCPWAQGGVHKEAAHHIGKYFKCFPEENKNETEDEETKSTEDEIKPEKKEATENEDIDNASQEENEINKEDEALKRDSKENVKNDEDNVNKENEEPEKEKSELQIKNEKLLECLQNVAVDELALSAELFYMWSYFPVIFGPYTDEQYLPETPESLLQNGRHKRLDLIVGINKDDGSHITNSLFLSEGRRMALKHHFPLVGPISLEFSDNDVAPLNMSIMAYDKYAGGLGAEAADAQNLTKLYTDRHFAVCTDIAADMHSTNNQKYKKNLYFYEFHYRGERTAGSEYGLNIGSDWVSHGDELYYLFPFNKTKDHVRSEEDEKMRKLILKMWYYFAETGNPTPNGTTDFTWTPYTVQDRSHLHLSAQPFMEEDQRVKIREFWNSLPTSQNIYLNKEYFLKVLNQTESEIDENKEINEEDEDRKEGHKKEDGRSGKDEDKDNNDKSNEVEYEASNDRKDEL